MRFVLACLVSLTLTLAMGCKDQAGTAPLKAGSLPPSPAEYPAFAGSASCRECHQEAYDNWAGSHHALAQRNMDPKRDDEVFSPRKIITHGSEVSYADKQDGQYALITTGPDGQRRPFVPIGVLGVDPLWQYLIPGPNGRVQMTELAWDPRAREWFNVYGNEDRKHWEWGHWSQRGMNWNSMCAICHTTAFQKNYDPKSDTYRSTFLELGVGCEQCHGPMAKHVEFQKQHPGGGYFGDKTFIKPTPDQYLAVCGSCHSRRNDLTGTFAVGDEYLDHFEPALPDSGDTFYADGQIRDEDFEYNVFMLSYMGQVGVRCNNCHEPHTAKLRRSGNDTCLDCHRASVGGRIAIDAREHGFHALDKPGSLCTDCHYPQTPYMQRHNRHDHGMTIPDPLLTKEYGLPNACDRCHADKGTEWSIEWVEKWYGKRMDRPTRTRNRLLARAHKGDPSAARPLIELLNTELNPAWRAVYIRMLAPLLSERADAATHQAIREAILARIDDPAGLPQAAALEVCEPLNPDLARVRERLGSPFRIARLKAAWLLRGELDPASAVGRELTQCIEYSLDHPAGALRYATWLTDRGQLHGALPWMQRAVDWDRGSAGLRHSYAVLLARADRLPEALAQLDEAVRLEPGSAVLHFARGLALAQEGRQQESTDALRRAATLDPRESRYWYNLALAEDELGNRPAAMEALDRAEQAEPAVADYPYTRATLYLKTNECDKATEALQRALKLDPSHEAARQLLESLR